MTDSTPSPSPGRHRANSRTSVWRRKRDEMASVEALRKKERAEYQRQWRERQKANVLPPRPVTSRSPSPHLFPAGLVAFADGGAQLLAASTHPSTPQKPNAKPPSIPNPAVLPPSVVYAPATPPTKVAAYVGHPPPSPGCVSTISSVTGASTASAMYLAESAKRRHDMRMQFAKDLSTKQTEYKQSLDAQQKEHRQSLKDILQDQKKDDDDTYKQLQQVEQGDSAAFEHPSTAVMEPLSQEQVVASTPVKLAPEPQQQPKAPATPTFPKTQPRLPNSDEIDEDL